MPHPPEPPPRLSPARRDAAVRAVKAGGPVAAVAWQCGVSEATLRRWMGRAKAAVQAGRKAVEGLVDGKRTGRPPKVWSRKGAPAAWRLWLMLYLQPEQPTFAGCWETVRRVAVTRGWRIAPVQTFTRRLRAEVPAAEVVLAREGVIAALATYPFQRRTVEGLAPLDFVNGDGYVHNVWVLPPEGGEPFRPRTWFWQDVRTRRILAWRSGPTESADLVRLALHDLVTDHGVPGAVVVDNTRAASAKWLVGGKGPRWRRDRGETVPGILDLLDIPVIHTSVEHEMNGKARGHGESKPVERAFRDLGEEVDKHPFAAGAYTGRDALHKPANYDARNALPWETFVRVVADGIAQHNARPGRRTEAAAGRSLDETWAAEIATAKVRRLTPGQEALLLLAVESTKVRKGGAFQLKAAGVPGLPQNTYWHKDLVGLTGPRFGGEKGGPRVVARFDPQHLHAGVEVFDLEGNWVCRAECHVPAGFADTEAAGKTRRAKRRHVKSLKQSLAALGCLEDALEESGITLPPAARPARGPQKVVRMTSEAAGRPDTERRKALLAKRDKGLKRVAESG